jgi:hypothetical protein
MALVVSCENKNEEAIESAAAESSANAMVSSSAAVENGKDSSRRFIRTAELKFRVKNVVQATYNIEDITKRQGGFVTYTNMTSNTDDVTITAVSSDSSLESTTFTVSNDITLRVPNTRLDTTLREISRNIDLFDYRIIKAEDVALQILSNNLAQKRNAVNEQRLTQAIDQRGKKLGETTEAEELLLNKQTQADEAKISNLSLKDQVNFSTVSLKIYQRQTVRRELIVNEENIEAYEPNLFIKLWESIKTGWRILEMVIVSLVKLWGFFLFGIILYVLYKKFWHKMK